MTAKRNTKKAKELIAQLLRNLVAKVRLLKPAIKQAA